MVLQAEVFRQTMADQAEGRWPIHLKQLPGSRRIRRLITLIEQHRVALAALCRRFKVRRLDLFGSAAKGTFDPPSSDLDFLVSLDDASPADYTDNYFGLANELERLLRRRVDLVTERSVRNPYFRQVIEATRQPVYKDDVIVWRTIQHHLPALKAEVEGLLGEGGS